jgi:hypothetical protein
LIAQARRTILNVYPRGLVVVILTVAGCASTPVRETQASASAGEGRVSFEQIRDPAAQPPRADDDKDYVRPRLEEGFTLPRYPDEALAAGTPPAEVVVRVVVATDGSVASVRPSPLADPPATDWDELFHGAVREAVSGWRYDPCRLREFEDGPDRDGDGAPDYSLMVASTPISVYLDVKFRFEIISGSGQVSMGADGG